MALASSSSLRQRPSLLLRFRESLHRLTPCRHCAVSFAPGSEMPHLFVGRGSRGGGVHNVGKYANNPGKYWDRFYRRHNNKVDPFFKDRHYLEKDWGRYFYVSLSWYPEKKKYILSEECRYPDFLLCSSKSQVGNNKDAFGDPKVVLEVGCGAGNTLFPLLDAFPDVFVHACDISPHAVSLIKSNGAFSNERVNAFVCDVALDDLCKKIDQSSVDIVTLIFMLSASSPIKMPEILQNIKNVLKPTGCILFRDYAVGDLSQEKLAMKKQEISENFYARGDGTCVFYFSEDSLSRLFRENGFNTLEVGVYSRQIENRAQSIVMDRHWIRAVFNH